LGEEGLEELEELEGLSVAAGCGCYRGGERVQAVGVGGLAGSLPGIGVDGGDVGQDVDGALGDSGVDGVQAGQQGRGVGLAGVDPPQGRGEGLPVGVVGERAEGASASR